MLTPKKFNAKQQQRDPLIIIVLSTVLASVLTVYPLPYDVAAWRPEFMFLIVLYWAMCQPTWCGVWFAFSLGLYTDLLLDAPLGLNALGYVLIIFVIRYLTRERRILTFINLWVIAALAVLAHLLLMCIAHIMAGENFSITRHWLPLLSSILFWPFLYYMLKRWRI